MNALPPPPPSRTYLDSRSSTAPLYSPAVQASSRVSPSPYMTHLTRRGTSHFRRHSTRSRGLHHSREVSPCVSMKDEGRNAQGGARQKQQRCCRSFLHEAGQLPYSPTYVLLMLQVLSCWVNAHPAVLETTPALSFLWCVRRYFVGMSPFLPPFNTQIRYGAPHASVSDQSTEQHMKPFWEQQKSWIVQCISGAFFIRDASLCTPIQYQFGVCYKCVCYV